MAELLVQSPIKPQLRYINSFFDNTPSLHGLIEKDILQYYGGYANSPRIAGFLSWLKDNETVLFQQLRQDVNNGNINYGVGDKRDALYMIGFWLGGRYMASRPECKLTEDQRFPKIEASELGSASGVSDKIHLGDDPIRDAGSAVESFIVGLNTGIHEHTHRLLFINRRAGGDADMLSELATYYTQTTYGLPIKPIITIGLLGMGSRHFPHAFDVLRASAPSLASSYVFNEYLEFLIGPWLKQYCGGMLDVFQFVPLDKPPLTLEGYGTGTYVLGHSMDDFLNFAGVADPDIRDKIKRVFAELEAEDPFIKDARMRNKIFEVDLDKWAVGHTLTEIKDKRFEVVFTKEFTEKFVRKFLEKMTEVFGPPYREDIAPGFANMFQGHKQQRQFPLDSVPVKMA